MKNNEIINLSSCSLSLYLSLSLGWLPPVYERVLTYIYMKQTFVHFGGAKVNRTAIIPLELEIHVFLLRHKYGVHYIYMYLRILMYLQYLIEFIMLKVLM